MSPRHLLLPLTAALAAAATGTAGAAGPVAAVPVLPASCFGVTDFGGRCTALGPSADLRMPADLALSPDGRFAYVAAGAGRVQILERDPATETLTPAGHVTAPEAPTGLAMSPDGDHLYVAGAAVHGSVRAYARDAKTGALGQVDGVVDAIGSAVPPGCVDARPA